MSRWFDRALAVALFCACEVEVVADLHGDHRHQHWPLAANVVIVAGVTLALLWRRRAPLASLVVAKSSLLLLTLGLADVKTVNFPQLVLFIAPYSVAAYSSRRRAVIGLGYSGAVICAVNVWNPSGASSWVFSIAACLASWVTGRIIRARRAAFAELEQTTKRIAAERGGHELLAIAEQRTSIALELQSLVGDSVSSMIVQAQAAQRLLNDDPRLADAAMATVEDTGRQALEEMRRILGVLRRSDDSAELAPQPGIGQIPALVEQIRKQQRNVVLRVDGEPGPLPGSVNLGTYRVLEETLTALNGETESIDVALRFNSHDIELAVTLSGGVPLDWPTVTMRERAALCQGTVDVDASSDGGERLTLRLPRLFEETTV